MVWLQTKRRFILDIGPYRHPYWIGIDNETRFWWTWDVLLPEEGNRAEEKEILLIEIYVVFMSPKIQSEKLQENEVDK